MMPEISAKTLFQKSLGFVDFKTFRASAGWEAARNAALLEFVESLPASVADPGKSWDSYCQIIGGRAVLDIFSRLHEPDEKPTPQAWPTLNYEANQPKTRP